MLISKQISGLFLLFSSKRVCCYCGARHNAEMDLYGTVYRCANRLRSCEHNISFKLLSDIPSSADAVTNGTIAQTDRVKYDKPYLAEIDLSVCQNFFVSFQPDDLRNNSRLLELLLKLNYLALNSNRKLVDNGRIDLVGFSDGESSFCELISHLVAGHDTHIIAGSDLSSGRKCNRKFLVQLDVVGGLVRGKADRDLISADLSAPRSVHSIGCTVLIISADDKHRVGCDEALVK